ncbi:MAG: hypothetical protein E7396_08985 [Ruminococcaceae bacterium]|nr:hypothetical protein [Oscillospiraceae bacterium]
MANITIDTNKIVSKIKPLHGVGQPPVGGLADKYFQNFHYLTEAGSPYSRLHDVAGAFGGNRFVDISNIFRDFDADVNDPSSYDFTFTDALIKALVEADVEPYYRLGETIENQAFFKSYRIDPPKDYEKWASICEHIVAHYIDGWADGYHYNITYWEIWGEPDDGLRISQLWNGTAEDYYRLYEVTSKKLKSRFGDRIKVGGYGAIGFYKQIALKDGNTPTKFHEYYEEFFYGFMKYVKETDSPIDFYSWHSYSSTENVLCETKWLTKEMEKLDMTHIEVHLNEWNPFADERGTEHHSAECMAMMLCMQNEKIDVMNLYDARIAGGNHMALFDPYTQKPHHAYYSLVAFDHLYKLQNQAELKCDTEGIYSLCATNGNKNVIVISNISGQKHELNIEGVNLDDARFSVIDQKRLLSWSPKVDVIENNQVVMIEF